MEIKEKVSRIIEAYALRIRALGYPIISKALEVWKSRIMSEEVDFTNKDALFDEYLHLLADVELSKIPREDKNKLLQALWKCGSEIEDLLVREGFIKPPYLFIGKKPRRLRHIVSPWLLLGLFLSFLLIGMSFSAISNFSNHETIDVNETIEVNPVICEHEVYWRYNFQRALYCVFHGDTLKEISKIARSLKGENELQTCHNILSLTAQFPYDPTREFRNDVFIQTPMETLQMRTGICSDFALLTAALLLDDNISPVYLLHIEFKRDIPGGGHAAAAVNINGTYYVLDQYPPPRPLDEFLSDFDRLKEISKVTIYEVDENRNIKKVRILKAKEYRDSAIPYFMLFLAFGVVWKKKEDWIFI